MSERGLINVARKLHNSKSVLLHSQKAESVYDAIVLAYNTNRDDKALKREK